MRLRPLLSLGAVFVVGALAAAGCGIDSDSVAVSSTPGQGGTVGGKGGGGGSIDVNGGNDQGGKGGSAGAGGDAGDAGNAGTGGAGAAGAPISTTCPGGSAEECNDSNPCTVDQCNDGICVFSAVLPGTTCDTDLDKCNGVGTCEGTTCKVDPATAIPTDDGDKCTEDVCDAESGIVTHPPRVRPSDKTACSDVICDPDTGMKINVDLKDDKNACTIDDCDLVMGPIHVDVKTGDGDPCTLDSCDPTQGIRHEVIVGCVGCSADTECDDGNPCTVDSCNADKKCTFANVGDGTSCDNSTVCDGRESCESGQCVNTAPPLVIDDKNPCTEDSCDAVAGVLHKAVAIDDNNACTLDKCDPTKEADQAISHTLLPLSDGDPCTDDSCSADVGPIHTPRAKCKSCNTVADCPSGKCVTSSCDKLPEGGVCNTANLQLSTPCPDGLVCNGNEICDGAGVCKAGTPPTVDDGNACTTDGCSEPGGVFHTPTGSCQACSVAAECPSPSDPCFVRACTGGKCTTAAAPTGTSCSDGKKCNGEEKCEAGTCKPGTAPNCGVVSCSGSSLKSPLCDESAPSADGCKVLTEDCGAANKVCSVGAQSCIGCDDSTNVCTSPQVCKPGAAPRLCCTPEPKTTTCGTRVCGSVLNNCGLPVDCGSCTSPNTCNGAGQCVCIDEPTATTCGAAVCGSKTNNCGKSVSCGACSGVNTCNGAGQCVCVDEPTATTCGSAVCGSKTNNCSKTVSCGTCGSGTTCNGSGQCVCVDEPLATTCGTSACGPTTNNCGTAVTCPDNCAAQGKVCLSGTCQVGSGGSGGASGASGASGSSGSSGSSGASGSAGSSGSSGSGGASGSGGDSGSGGSSGAAGDGGSGGAGGT
jgi:hypothetical protein